MKRIVLILALLSAVFVVGGQQARPTKEQLSKSLENARKKQEEIRRRLSRVNSARAAVKRDIKAVDQDLTRVATQLVRTEDRLENSVERRDELAGDLEVASAQLSEQRRKVENRLRQIYRQPDRSVLSLLSGSKTVGQFAERKALLERIADHDRQVFEKYKSLRDGIHQKKKEQESLIGEIVVLKNEQQERKSELQDVQDEKKQVLSDLERERRKLEREFEQYDRQSRIIQDRIANYQRERKESGDEISFGGVMIKPAAGPYTSSFGSRYHPILRRVRPHNGIDIGANHGSAIKAAASGYVIAAGWMNGFGNTVVIDHGDGISTLYAHCSAIFVGEGESVKMGERIAAIGSTGLATGPHLHFEVRVNGRPVNPVRYLP